jgi:hypothetical protein
MRESPTTGKHCLMKKWDDDYNNNDSRNGKWNNIAIISGITNKISCNKNVTDKRIAMQNVNNVTRQQTTLCQNAEYWQQKYTKYIFMQENRAQIRQETPVWACSKIYTNESWRWGEVIILWNAQVHTDRTKHRPTTKRKL